MIIGNAEINYEELREYRSRPNELIQYVENTIPCWARDIPSIKDNQRYYVAIHLRKMLTLSYKERMVMVECLTTNIKIRGVIFSFTPIQELIDVCNKEQLILMLKEVLSNER